LLHEFIYKNTDYLTTNVRSVVHLKNLAENSYITSEVVIFNHIKLNHNNVTHSEYSDRWNYDLLSL